MKINFKEVAILNLNSEPFKDVKVNELVSSSILKQKGDPIMIYELAKKVWAGEEIEINTTEKDIIEKAVKEDEQLFNIAKAQILLAIKNNV